MSCKSARPTRVSWRKCHPECLPRPSWLSYQFSRTERLVLTVLFFSLRVWCQFWNFKKVTHRKATHEELPAAVSCQGCHAKAVLSGLYGYLSRASNRTKNVVSKLSCPEQFTRFFCRKSHPKTLSAQATPPLDLTWRSRQECRVIPNLPWYWERLVRSLVSI